MLENCGTTRLLKSARLVENTLDALEDAMAVIEDEFEDRGSSGPLQQRCRLRVSILSRDALWISCRLL